MREWDAIAALRDDQAQLRVDRHDVELVVAVEVAREESHDPAAELTPGEIYSDFTTNPDVATLSPATLPGARTPRLFPERPDETPGRPGQLPMSNPVNI